MLRSKRNVRRLQPSRNQLEQAVNAMKEQRLSQRKACKEFGVSRATLQRFLRDDEAGNYKSFKNCCNGKIQWA